VRAITPVKPVNTQAISVTGDKCPLNCVHCQGYFLKSMSTKPNYDYESFLISGGCDLEGKVPIDIGLLRKLKAKNKKINVHPGLVDEHRAMMFGRYADVVCFDFVSDSSVINSIYNLRKTEQDFINSYLFLKRHTRVVPHIMIGFGNEIRSLSILKKLGASEICIIILMKHKRIRNNLEEPTVNCVENILKRARGMFDIIHLGCMRPLDRKKEIDPIAAKYVDTMVNPHSCLACSDKKKDVCCCL